MSEGVGPDQGRPRGVARDSGQWLDRLLIPLHRECKRDGVLDGLRAPPSGKPRSELLLRPLRRLVLVALVAGVGNPKPPCTVTAPRNAGITLEGFASCSIRLCRPFVQLECVVAWHSRQAFEPTKADSRSAGTGPRVGDPDEPTCAKTSGVAASAPARKAARLTAS